MLETGSQIRLSNLKLKLNQSYCELRASRASSPVQVTCLSFVQAVTSGLQWITKTTVFFKCRIDALGITAPTNVAGILE